MPSPTLVENAGGRTLVTNAGSNGKFLAVLDLDIGHDGVRDYRYKLVPVFSNFIDADPEMASLIERIRAPHADTLAEELAVADTLLYRRGNFNGTFDQLICDAQRIVGDAQSALSPGFRWGMTIVPGEAVTMERVLDQTATTYPETYVREMKGSDLKLIFEDVADNLFNPDPYYQQGGDMVRVGGLDYVCDPTRSIGSRISDMTLDDGERSAPLARGTSASPGGARRTAPRRAAPAPCRAPRGSWGRGAGPCRRTGTRSPTPPCSRRARAARRARCPRRWSR